MYSMSLRGLISLGIFCKVKQIPYVHLPVLAKNYVPKQKFMSVDLPVLYCPMTETTIHFLCSISPRIALSIFACISSVRPSISSTQSPSCICQFMLFSKWSLNASYCQYLQSLDSRRMVTRARQKYSYESDFLKILSSRSCSSCMNFSFFLSFCSFVNCKTSLPLSREIYSSISFFCAMSPRVF